jgi:predicted amidohydrolase YtcJ
MSSYRSNGSSNPKLHPGLSCGCCSLSLNAWVKYVRETDLANEVFGHVSALSDCVSRRNFIRTGAFLIGAAGTLGSKSFAQAQSPPAETPTSELVTPSTSAAITVFVNGTILTVDEEFSVAEAMAIQGNQILAVGSRADVLQRLGDEVTQIDLAGKTVLPGFVDPHVHAVTGALIANLMEYVGIARFTTTEEVLNFLRERAAVTAPGEWIAARNFDPSVQAGPGALTFAELDAVSTEHPIFVLNASGHLAYANSAAFAVAEIPPDIANPPGAEFVRDAKGNLNGVMKNNVAFGQVLLRYPAISTADPVAALLNLATQFNQVGLTTVSEFSLGPADMEMMNATAATGKLTTRIRAYSFYTYDAAWDELGLQPHTGDEIVRIAGYKLVSDGSNQGYTGLQREPYLNTDNYGLAYTEPEELTRLATKRSRQGWQLAIHANGDRAIDNVLDTLEAVQSTGIDLRSLRPRIEHCSILHDEQIARMKELGVSASFLIGHVYYWGVAFRDEIFGEEKAELLDRARSCETAGVGFTLHSDFMVTDPNPLQMIEIAVTRRTQKEPDYALAPWEAVTVESAIRAVTSEAAWQLNSDHEVGSLEPGKFADFVILENDPRRVTPAQISEIKVLATWMNGQPVYQI